MLCYYFSLDYNNNQATILTIKICKCMHNQCHVHNTILAEHKTMVEPRSKDSSQKLFSICTEIWIWNVDYFFHTKKDINQVFISIFQYIRYFLHGCNDKTRA